VCRSHDLYTGLTGILSQARANRWRPFGRTLRLGRETGHNTDLSSLTLRIGKSCYRFGLVWAAELLWLGAAHRLKMMELGKAGASSAIGA
jgi:hypothetical protein